MARISLDRAPVGPGLSAMLSAEFRTGWRVVAAAAAGAGLGVSGLLTYNAGLFQPALAQQIGLGAGQFGAGVFASTLATAAAVPLVGRAVDRVGARPVAAAGAALLAVGFVALAFATRSPAGFVLVMGLTGLLGSGCTPVPFTRAVSARFDRSRGIALGLTQVGIGLSAALVPPLVGRIIADHGWRSGYLVLAGLAFAGVLPALLALPGRDGDDRTRRRPPIATEHRSALFLTQLAAFVTMAFAFAGMLSHFVPMLSKAGVPIARASALAGTIGLSVIVSRVVIGWLADRIDPAWLGAASCAICAGGCLLLGIGGAAAAVPGAVALGTAMGAEADLIAILTARHFPIRLYGRLYARQYAAFMVAAGLGPMWIGWAAGRYGGYQVPLAACAGLLMIPALLFCLLPGVRRRT